MVPAAKVVMVVAPTMMAPTPAPGVAQRHHSEEKRESEKRDGGELSHTPSRVNRDRDADGRFSGPRVDVEQVPRLPTFPARWVLDDPRRRQYVVFWVSDDGDRCHAIRMAPTGQPDSVMVTRRGAPSTHDPASLAATRYG
jgi:hypothetical protein